MWMCQCCKCLPLLMLLTIRRVWAEAVHLSLQVQQAPARVTALPDLFADSPDCLDDLDVSNAVSAHQQQIARPQALQGTATAAHAACHVTQQPQHASGQQPPSLKLKGSASVLGSTVRDGNDSATGGATATLQSAAEREAVPVEVHASAAPHEPVLSQRPAGLGGRSPAPHTVQHQDSSAASELCSHGVLMLQCRLKQDHINHINAELVDFLMQKRAAPPGAIERLTAQRDAMQGALDREKEAPHAGPGQHSGVSVGAPPSNAWGRQQNLPSTSHAARLGSSCTSEAPYGGPGMAGHPGGSSTGKGSMRGSFAAGATSAGTWQPPAAQQHHSYEGAGRGGASSGQGHPTEHSRFGQDGAHSTWHEGGSWAAGVVSYGDVGRSFGQDGPRGSWQENGVGAGLSSYERGDLSSIPDPALRQSFDQNVEEESSNMCLMTEVHCCQQAAACELANL